MRIAVTGKSGQVVSAILERGRLAGHEIIALGRPELDLLDEASVREGLYAESPDVVVSAAAYTAVDKAESEPETAHAVNEAGAGCVAQVASELGVPLVHISTDYVFAGNLDRPYEESDPTGPSGVYGASKLGGELAVLNGHENSAILRVAWVYSPFGANFVKTMLRLAGDRDEISVVADQIGNPTSALDIADGVLEVAARLVTDPDPKLRGVFHMTARGEASWADFAKAIFTLSAERGGPFARVRSITTSEYPTPAARPGNSRLNCGLIEQTHGVVMPDWRSSLPAVLSRLILGKTN